MFLTSGASGSYVLFVLPCVCMCIVWCVHVGSMYVSIMYCSMGCVRVVCALCVEYIHACV